MKRGADTLVRVLREAGNRYLFALSGNHVMPVFDALVDSGITLVHTRHEASAVHMADAYARVSGACGVAMVTGGPGHANAIAALYTAAMSESPLVLISGHAPLRELGMGAFQEMAQAEIAAPLAKASWTCASANAVGADLRRALALARSGRPGPVHLSIPSDCLEEPATEERPDGDREESKGLPSAAARAITERLSRARSPLVLTGPASLTRTERTRMQALEEALGVPVIGMESPRGIADPSLGAFAEVLARADCILLLGKKLDFTLRFARAPALRGDCEFLQVDPDPREIDRARRAVGERLALTEVADIPRAAEAMRHAAVRQHGGWCKEVRDAIAHRPVAWESTAARTEGRLHPVQALRPLQRLLDEHPDAVFVSDGGEFGQWAQACLEAPHRVINGVAGAIGAGLPFALGARAAVPDAPIIATMGDGTFGFHAAEIDTAVRHALPFVAVIGNDARWNAEYQIQLREYGKDRAHGCELLPTRYDEVAVAFGGFGEQVTSAAALLPAARRARGSNRPACLNVMVEGLPAPVIASTAR